MICIYLVFGEKARQLSMGVVRTCSRKHVNKWTIVLHGHQDPGKPLDVGHLPQSHSPIITMVSPSVTFSRFLRWHLCILSYPNCRKLRWWVFFFFFFLCGWGKINFLVGCATCTKICMHVECLYLGTCRVAVATRLPLSVSFGIHINFMKNLWLEREIYPSWEYFSLKTDLSV
jgi:hypothetical protein